MKTSHTLALVLTASMAMSGCVNVLPKTKPVQLYRFGYVEKPVAKDSVAANDAPLGPDTAVNMGQIDFPQEASSDRILTTEGNEISYVGGSRWAVPARQLFNEAVSVGFSRDATTVRLDPRGPATAAYRLDMTVHKFESAYRHGRPTIVVSLDARVIRLSDRVVVGQKTIGAEVPVKRSDMSMMADAYDQATTQTVSQLVDFTQTTVAANPVPDTKAGLPPAK